jgi:hypothetical protein
MFRWAIWLCRHHRTGATNGERGPRSQLHSESALGSPCLLLFYAKNRGEPELHLIVFVVFVVSSSSSDHSSRFWTRRIIFVFPVMSLVGPLVHEAERSFKGRSRFRKLATHHPGERGSDSTISSSKILSWWAEANFVRPPHTFRW